MTHLSLPPRFHSGSRYSCFVENITGDSGTFLQLYTPVPIDKLTAENPPAIHVSTGWVDEECWYRLYSNHDLIDNRAHAWESAALWDGVGTGIPYDAQYSVFTAVPEKAGQYERVVHLENGTTKVERLLFSATAREITLETSYPGLLERSAVKKLYLERKTGAPAPAG